MIQNTNTYTVITGASSGIGYATAKEFAARGSNLILAARRRDRMEKLKQEILKLNPTLDIIIKGTDLSIYDNVIQFYKEIKEYPLKTWINNAGFGNYASVAEQNLTKINNMLRLNIEALTTLSSLFVRDFQHLNNTQLINVSSCGGYRIVANAVTYCASKFFVSAFTEGLARELKNSGAKMQAKVLAPAATQTEFGKIASDKINYNYDKSFGTYHSSKQMAEFLLKLYDSNKTVGIVDRDTFEFKLLDPLFSYTN